MFPNRMVVAQAPLLKPQTSIQIAVDTAYVIGQAGKDIGAGVYMMDNRVSNGSKGEGNLELHTSANVGDLVGFRVHPINPNSSDSVEITGFNVSSGSVFGSNGTPREQQTPDYWIGQALNAGNQTYQIQIKVTSGGLQPLSYFVNWDPFLTAR
jgi:Inclusion body protein